MYSFSLALKLNVQFFSAPPPTKKFSRYNKWIKLGDSEYYFNSASRLDWYNSRKWCKNYGADLLYIISENESQGFIELVCGLLCLLLYAWDK